MAANPRFAVVCLASILHQKVSVSISGSFHLLLCSGYRTKRNYLWSEACTSRKLSRPFLLLQYIYWRPRKQKCRVSWKNISRETKPTPPLFSGRTIAVSGCSDGFGAGNSGESLVCSSLWSPENWPSTSHFLNFRLLLRTAIRALHFAKASTCLCFACCR